MAGGLNTPTSTASAASAGSAASAASAANAPLSLNSLSTSFNSLKNSMSNNSKKNTKNTKNNNNNNNNNDNNDSDKSKASSASSISSASSASSASIDSNKSKSVSSINASSQNKSHGSASSEVIGTGASDALQSATKEVDVGNKILTENYLLLLGITSAVVVIIIAYFFSQTFRVGRSVSQMEIYKQFLQLSSLDYGTFGNNRLGDYNISSAYNASHAGYQMFDYTSEKIVLTTLQSGARYLEFNIFNNEYGSNAYPVASMGYKSGEWKMMISDTPLETIFETITNNAFKIYDGEEGVDNPDDPLFIGLNLNTNSNLDCLNLTAYLTTKYFGDRLLPNLYSFQNNDHIADIPMSQLMGKVVLFSSDGYQGSGLEEIINYSWDNVDNNPNHAMQRLHYSNITVAGFDKNKLIAFNRTGLTIIVPHIEGDFWNTNYNPNLALDLGCHFVSMEFQYIDANMDYYITHFKNKSFILKNDDLQTKHTKAIIPMTTNLLINTTPITTKTITTKPITTNKK